MNTSLLSQQLQCIKPRWSHLRVVKSCIFWASQAVSVSLSCSSTGIWQIRTHWVLQEPVTAVPLKYEASKWNEMVKEPNQFQNPFQCPGACDNYSDVVFCQYLSWQHLPVRMTCFLNVLDTQPKLTTKTVAGPAAVHLHHWRYESTSKPGQQQLTDCAA